MESAGPPHAKGKGKGHRERGGKSNPADNPKAFGQRSHRAAEKAARRSLDVQQKKLHVPLVDRSSDHPPPLIVAVVGAPRTGKSTLIRSLVKRYTKHNLNEVRGPVTVVSGKKRRITFIECANDLNAMVDIGKIADLVLLVIDGSFGFEMETFEFLNVLQVHGFPRIIGVLTHLDGFKDNKRLRKTKKDFKQRFWTEIYDGAKLFYLSGLINGRYSKTEILNLSRFISVMKFRPLVWRNTHSYVLCDRVEDITHPETVEQNQKCDREVTLYGYLRGTNLKSATKVHLAGVGDFTLSELSVLPDPCPLPDEVRRTLSDKHKTIYAPMSNVSGVLFDRDAVYINVPGVFSKAVPGQDAEERTVGERLVMVLQDADTTIADTLKGATMRMFDGTEPSGAGPARRKMAFGAEVSEGAGESSSESEDTDKDRSNDGSDGEDARDAESDGGGEVEDQTGDEESAPDEQFAFADSDSDLEGDDVEGTQDNGVRWKEHMAQRAAEAHRALRPRLQDIIYGSEEPTEAGSDAGNKTVGEFFTVKERKEHARVDSSRRDVGPDELEGWGDAEKFATLRRHFITGDSTVAIGVGEEDNVVNADSTGDGFTQKAGENGDEDVARSTRKTELKRKFDSAHDQDSDEEGTVGRNVYETTKSEMERQKALNDIEFEGDEDALRNRVEGVRSGAYIRIRLSDVPCEFVTGFDARYPVLLGGLLPSEETLGLMQVRLKKHRWFPRILKTNDPLIFSVGWRRFQALPTYSIDDGTHNRLLKYTPEHMHCLATFSGHFVSPNTGVCAFKSLSDQSRDFRVSATGVVLDNSKSTEIVKKLKLTGVPLKVHKNTAFIKGMFSSVLEVAKFEGASLRTVSGIRGQVKKALSSPEGSFRAAFEDKILMSDIVILRTWYPVKPRTYYNPVTSSLSWRGMRTMAQIRSETGASVQQNADSNYREIERPARKFNTLKISKSLQSQLPFSSKPKLVPKKKKPTLLERRAVVMETDEKRIQTLMQQLNTIRQEKLNKRKVKRAEAATIRQRKEAKESQITNEKKKAKRKETFRSEGLKASSAEGPRKRRKL